jgi:hypothetical protein
VLSQSSLRHELEPFLRITVIMTTHVEGREYDVIFAGYVS